MKTLVLYYSRSGNTRTIAEAIAATLQADLEELKDSCDYSGALGYMRGGRDALAGRKAEIAPLKHDPAQYDRIVLGQPVWAARPVPAVAGLLSGPGLAGRKVALFVTFDGGGDAGCLAKTEALLAPGQVTARKSFLRVGRHRAERVKDAQEWAAGLT